MYLVSVTVLFISVCDKLCHGHLPGLTNKPIVKGMNKKLVAVIVMFIGFLHSAVFSQQG